MANIAIYTFNSSTDTLPVFNSGFTYNYTDVNNGNRTITRTITSDSLPTSISFKDKTGLVSLSYLDTSDVTSMSGMFNKCESLTSIDLSSFNTSNVTSMSEMFAKCYSLISVKGLDTIDTSKVTNMSYMFDNCDNLSTIEKINNMDTSSVTEMIEMFNGCYSLSSIDLSDWNTSNLVNAVRMFDACTRLRTANLSGLDFSSLVDAYYMFNNCTSLESVDLSGITTWARNLSIRSMFESCSSLTTLKLGGLTQHITSCYDMFKGATALKSIIIDNSSIDSINQIINKLPTRTSSSYGTLTVPDLDESLNKTTANSKYWNVVKTPKYSFTMSTLKYFLNKLKEKFALRSESDNKVDRVILQEEVPARLWIKEQLKYGDNDYSIEEKYFNSFDCIKIEIDSKIYDKNDFIGDGNTLRYLTVGSLDIEIHNNSWGDTSFWNVFIENLSTSAAEGKPVDSAYVIIESQYKPGIEKMLVSNDYTDEYAQLNNKIINDITISDKTDTEIQLTFESNNGNNTISIPYDKYKKSALFVDCDEEFYCENESETIIPLRYITSIKEYGSTIIIEKIRNGEIIEERFNDLIKSYTYIPHIDDTELRIYAIDPEGTKTGITYLKPIISE